MPRTCRPCLDKRRNELDQRLLQKGISGESFRRIAADFGYSETALRRHLANHLSIDLADVHAVMKETREKALTQIHKDELEEIKQNIELKAKESMVARLETCTSFFDQLKILRERAALSLERAEGTEDIRAVLASIRELRETLRLWAEIEGKLKANQINVNVDIYSSTEWAMVGRVLAEILEHERPELRQKVAQRLYELAEEAKNK